LDSIKLPGPLNEGVVHLWIADLRAWRKHTGNLESLLSDEERRRLERLKVIDKREEFLCSRGILRIILSGYNAQDPRDLLLKNSSTGKPFLPQSRIQFNLSHSGDIFACGICFNNQIGLDIQEIYPISSLDRIINNFFSPSEITYLATLPTRDIYQKHFFAIWTAKEAYLKAVGDGIQESFNQLSVIPESADLQAFRLKLPGPIRDELAWTINALNVGQGFNGALAYNGDLIELERYEIAPEDFFISK